MESEIFTGFSDVGVDYVEIGRDTVSDTELCGHIERKGGVRRLVGNEYLNCRYSQFIRDGEAVKLGDLPVMTLRASRVC